MIDFQVAKTKLGTFTFKDGQKKTKTRVDVYDQCLDIFEKGKNPIKSYFWTDITYLSIVNENQMHFIFSEESFIFPKNKEFDLLFPLIIEILQRTLLKPALNKLNLSKFSAKKDLPSDVSVFTRFYSLISRYQFENEIINKFSNDLFYKKKTIDFRQYDSNIDFVTCILNTLPICSFISSIIVPSSCFSVFVDYLREPTPKKLHFLCLEGDFSESLLKNVIQYLPHLRGISISKSNFNIHKILRMIESTKIKSVEFHSIDNLKFEEPIGVLSLNFDGFDNLNLKSYAPFFTGLAYLSLANCGLEISEVFQVIKNNNLIIKKLNISGNKFDNPCTFDDLTFSTIVADDVTFGKNCLISLVSFQTQILSLKNAQMADDSEWNSAIEIIGKSATHSLYWDCNYLNEQFFSYANKFYVLSLSECSRLTQGLGQIFISFLEKANNLSELILRGSEDGKYCLGQLTSKIIDSVSHINLKRFDIKYSNGGDNALDRLVELIKSDNCPKKIEFDGINASDNNKEKLFHSIFEAAKEKNVKISFPVKEVGNDKSLIDIIKKAHFKEKEDGFFVQPCCVYLEAEKLLIPRYIKDSALKTLFLHRTAQIVINPIFSKGQIVVERNPDISKFLMNNNNSCDEKDFVEETTEIRSLQNNNTIDEASSVELIIPTPFESKSNCSHSSGSINPNDIKEKAVKLGDVEEEEETLSHNFIESEKELPKPKVNMAKEIAKKRRNATKTEFTCSPPKNIVKTMLKKTEGRAHDWAFPDFEKHEVDTNQIWEEMENKFELIDLCNQLKKEKKRKNK